MGQKDRAPTLAPFLLADKEGHIIMTDEEEKDLQAIEMYETTREILQAVLNDVMGEHMAVAMVHPGYTADYARRLEYVIYINQNFLSVETLKALNEGLKRQSLQYHFKAVGSVNTENAWGRDAVAIRPKGMYQAGEEMRAGNLRMLITITPLF